MFVTATSHGDTGIDPAMFQQLGAHYLSQVLLKQFALQGTVKVEDVESGSIQPAKIKDIAYILHDAQTIRPAEDKWSREVEVLAKPVFRALKKGDLLAQANLVERAKLLITLHYVRSAAVYEVHLSLNPPRKSR